MNEDDTFRILSRPSMMEILDMMQKIDDDIGFERYGLICFLKEHGWTYEEYQKALNDIYD